jgi:hypothetical protein
MAGLGFRPQVPSRAAVTPPLFIPSCSCSCLNILVVLFDHPQHACRSFATPTWPLDGFLGLASEACAGHCFAIQSQPAPARLSVATRRHAKASDANPRSPRGTNSRSRTATACVSLLNRRTVDSSSSETHRMPFRNRWLAQVLASAPLPGVPRLQTASSFSPRVPIQFNRSSPPHQHRLAASTEGRRPNLLFAPKVCALRTEVSVRWHRQTCLLMQHLHAARPDRGSCSSLSGNRGGPISKFLVSIHVKHCAPYRKQSLLG